MSSEKTEKPTSQRLREARRKGNVARSKEINSLTLLATLLTVLLLAAAGMTAAFSWLMTVCLDAVARPFNQGQGIVLTAAGMCLASMLGPFFIAAIAASIIANVAQTGFLLTFECLKPDFKKINPVEGLKRIFSPDHLFEFLISVIKLAILAVVGFIIICDCIPMVLSLFFGSIGGIPAAASQLLRRILIWISAIFSVVALADYLFQRYRHTAKLRMAKDEVKREYKDNEGDPHIKSRRKQLFQETANRSMLEKAKKATVLIVNPTHIAVALFYEEGSNTLPIVLGKGEGHVARQLLRMAKEEGIPVMRDIPLARALYSQGVEDQCIPTELIRPVAEVLKWARYHAPQRPNL